MLAKRSSRAKPRVENASYWMSYSDMMAATLLMFVLLLFLSFVRYVTLRAAKDEEVSMFSIQLQATEADLTLSQGELSEREKELALMQAAYYEQQLELDLQSETLTKKEEEISQSLAKMLLQEKAIEEQNALLAMSAEELELIRSQLAAQKLDLEEQAIMLSAKDAQLLAEMLRVTDLETLLNQQKSDFTTQTHQIDELVGVRARIIEQLRDAFRAEGLPVTVDQSGALTMDSTIFFDTAQWRIKIEGQQVLNQILPIYFRTLLQEGNFEYVSEIIIEGHTDSDGTYESNLELSQRRAQAVSNYCLSDASALTNEEKEQIRKIITANGRSKSRLIFGPDGQEDKAASRRVEIKFRLNDAEMVESMSRILAGLNE